MFLNRNGLPYTAVFDIDGTICFDGRGLERQIVAEIQALEVSGVEIIFSSARPVRDILPILDGKFPRATLIGANGALIYEKGRLFATSKFTQDQTDGIVKYLVSTGTSYLVDGVWNFSDARRTAAPFWDLLDPWKMARRCEIHELDPVVRILAVDVLDVDSMVGFATRYGVEAYPHHGESVVSVAPPLISKWTALVSLGHAPYIAFGNDMNDYALLDHSVFGVQVGFHAGLHGVADLIVDPAAGAVAAIIRRFRKLLSACDNSISTLDCSRDV